MKHLAFATIPELVSMIEQKKISIKELHEFFYRRFELLDDQLGCALELFDQSTISSKNPNGPLHGIPGLIKDNILIENRHASCASLILKNFIAPYSATAIEQLQAQGATFIGRANMDEFAMGSSTETSAYKKTKNPWNLACVPGGSSGGSAAAVAAGLVPWALGSDTGGSVRQPAALCGVVGLKPTYGAISRYGLVGYGSSLDQIGIFTRSVYDSALLFSSMAGVDARDSSTLQIASRDYTKQLDGKLSGTITIGIVDNALHAKGIDLDVKNALNEAILQFEKMGAVIKHINLPTMEYSAATYFIISRAEAASNLARFDGIRYGLRDKKAKTLNQLYENSRHEGFGPEVRSRIMIGNYVLSAGHAGEYYDNARKVRQQMRHEFAETFKNIDLLLMPTSPSGAFEFGAYDADKLQMDLQDYFTCIINLVGGPAISLPCGFTKNNLPIGLQLIGNHSGEELLFKTAYAYEQSTEWHLKHPEGY